MSGGVRMASMPTGIPGLDHLLYGGIVRGNSLLVEGPPGSGKSTFGVRMVYEGIVQYDEPGLIITFEEFPKQVYQEALGYGVDLAAMEASGKLRVVWTPPSRILEGFSGKSDLVDKIVGDLGVRRLVIDSITHFKRVAHDEVRLRETLAEVINHLKLKGINSILIKELENTDESTIAFEEYLVDASIRLHNAPSRAGGENVRYVEIRKTRGKGHVSGRHPFTFSSSGIRVFPNLRPQDVRTRKADADAAPRRVPVGVDGVDSMLGGGVWNGSLNMVAGTPGSGKSVLSYHFLDTGLKAGEPVLLISMRQSAAKVISHALSLGLTWKEHRESGRLDILEISTIGTSVEEILNTVHEKVLSLRPGRIVVDSIDDVWGVAHDDDRVRDALLVLDEMAESRGATMFVLHQMRPRDGVQDVRSDYADVAGCVMQVTQVETDGEQRRFFGVRKFSGADHAKELREFHIDGRGFHLGQKPTGLSGILSGNTTGALSDLSERVVPALEELGGLVRELDGNRKAGRQRVHDLRAKHALLDVLLREHFGLTDFHKLAEELRIEPRE